MDVRITAGTATQPTTEVTQSGASVGTVGHRITTTPLAAAREAARSDLHPVAVDRLEALVDGHRLVVEEPGHLVAALAHRRHAHHLVEEPGHPEAALDRHRPHARHLVVEVPGHPEAALVHRQRVRRLVAGPLARQREAGSVHPERAAQARLDRVHHLVDLALRVHHLAEVHRAQEAARALAVEASSAGGVAAHVRVAAASLVVVAADAVPVDLVALEAAGDDRFSLCNGRRLGFHDAA